MLSFTDPSYEREEIPCKVEHSILSGVWKFRTDEEDGHYRITLIPQSGIGPDKLVLAFSSFEDRNFFIRSAYSSYPLEQEGSGVTPYMDEGKVLHQKINSNLFFNIVRYSIGQVQRIVGIIAAKAPLFRDRAERAYNREG